MKDQIIFIGRLGSEPELKYTVNQTPVCRFSVAERTENKEVPKWHNVVAWGKEAEYCKAILKKGEIIFVQGRVDVSKWNDNSGNPRESFEVKAYQIGKPLFENQRGVNDRKS